jgi:prepilin-type N-terminal cleavage/methylation domain-containing protein
MTRTLIKRLRRRAESLAFTLIELLVVVAILTVLAAILLPVLAQARASARRTVCISNLRQIGLALNLYRQDYEDLPPHLSVLTPVYVTDPRVWLCPNDINQGQVGDSLRQEGTMFLPTGVSYTYVPQWTIAQQLGWWQTGPPFGEGKWGDLTPVTECIWHWARKFDPSLSGNGVGVRGWQLELMMTGSVRRIRVEQPVDDFSPDKYY